LVRFCHLSKAEEAGVQCVTNLIDTLGVEEKTRAKDTSGKKVFDEGGSSAILLKKNSCFSQQEKGISLLSSLQLLQTLRRKVREKAYALCVVALSIGLRSAWLPLPFMK
jgi:hypothetical protein